MFRSQKYGMDAVDPREPSRPEKPGRVQELGLIFQRTETQTNTGDSTIKLPVRKIRGSEKLHSQLILRQGLNLLLPVFLAILWCRIASELLGGEKEEAGSKQTRSFISKHYKWTKLIFPCSENIEGRKTRFGDEIEKKNPLNH